MEADTAFVRADGVVELYAIADVVLNFTFVVNPSYAECEDAVRFNHALDDACFLELGVLVVNVFYAEENFFHCLEKFFFTRVFSFKVS